ncbi:ABC transporter permease [bacterium SCSIO 12741]|nr:ABC transporter permease [bacterium SCSIO 12741]
MIKNYFLVALRNLIKNRTYGIINITGLALGIACAVLIALYVRHETSFDQFHDQKEQLFRVCAKLNYNGELNSGLSSMAVGPTLMEEYAEIETFTRITPYGARNLLRVEDRFFNQSQIQLVDSGFLAMFGYKLLQGNPETALRTPRSIVLSETLAQKLFPNENALDQPLRVDFQEFKVTGIIEDCPDNSDIQYSALVSMSTIPPQRMQVLLTDWFRIATQTYVKTRSVTSQEQWSEILGQLSEKHVRPFVEENQLNGGIDYSAQAIAEVHLDNTKEYDTPKADTDTLLTLGLIAIFLLLVACINYVNLSLAQSTRRSKEIGVRKTLGADRGQILLQFLLESIILSVISLFVALILVELSLPFYNDLADKNFSISQIFRPDMILLLIGLVLVTGVLSGLYPAVVLSRLQAASVMRPMKNLGILRKGLVVVQFAFSLFMLIGMFTINGQLGYLKDQELGFTQERLMVLEIPRDTALQRQLPVIQQEMQQIPGVENASLTNNIPGIGTGELMFRVERNHELTEQTIKMMFVDEKFLSTLGVEILQGRNFNRDMQTDQRQAFIINEKAAEAFGWGQEALDKRIQWGLLPNNQAESDGKIVGVMADFHFQSLHQPIEPLVLIFSPRRARYLMVDLGSQNTRANLDAVKAKWQEFDPNHPLEYFLVDERFNEAYAEDDRLMTLFTGFALISALIALLGLFALSSYLIELKTKEIGIRKILGGDWLAITFTFSKEFLVLVALGFLFCAPFCWWYLSDWLENFAYRQELDPLVFIASGAIGLILASVTLSYQTFRIATNNPVESLRYE